jgi:serine O-acetyltransferase
MKELFEFLTRFSFNPMPRIEDAMIKSAFDATVKDVKFHNPETKEADIKDSISLLNSELSIFLFRLGQLYYNKQDKKVITYLHGLLRTLCSCELYFSNQIGEGFYPVHALGTVIGSRCNIGKGFLIYHNCTIGHIADDEIGCTIGDYVTVFPGSMILGDVRIGNDVVVGANSVVFSDIQSNSICAGNPAKVIKEDSFNEMKKHRANYRSESQP